MDVIFTHCAGLDVHKKSVMACRLIPDPTGKQADGLMEVREFGPLTIDLLALSDWLAEAGITPVAMESTAEYWKPVVNLLAGNFQVFLVNAAHVKRVPGRKTAKADARWLAQLRRYGLLQASFIPPQDQRELRDLTRDRTKLLHERSREVNRVQGVLERATINLASGAAAIMGMSGRAMLAALIEGRVGPATLATLAHGRLRSKIPLLEPALTGLVRDHHRRLRVRQLAHIDVLDEQIAALRAESTRDLEALGPDEPPATVTSMRQEGSSPPALDAPIAPMTFARAVAVLDTMPGGNQRGAERWVAEIGINMARFGTASRLAAWSGVAPGHEESAGQQRSGKTRNGSRVSRAALTQLAHAAARAKGTYLSALYQRLARRRGKKRAIVAVAHAMVVSACHMLSRNAPDQELGADYFDQRQRHQLVDRLARRLEHLGYQVQLEPRPTTAS
jgi:transposase